MSLPPRILVRYGTPVLFVALALLATFLLWPLIKPQASPLFLTAIIISAWRGGKGPGLLEGRSADQARPSRACTGGRGKLFLRGLAAYHRDGRVSEMIEQDRSVASVSQFAEEGAINVAA